jgi:acetate kinase
VAHRIVHGGERFREEVAIDRTVVPELRGLTDLARLHRPKSSRWMPSRRCSWVCPRSPALPRFRRVPARGAAATYRLPAQWRKCLGAARVRLSRALAQLGRGRELLATSPNGLRIVSWHLGVGAVRD